MIGNAYQFRGGSRGLQGGGPAPLTQVRSHIRKITFFDVFAFAAIFLVSLFNSLTERSLVFNIVIGATMILKVLLGIPFYDKRTLGSLRTYFILRYLFNLIIFCPVLILLRSFTSSYLLNYLYAGSILLVFEVLIGLFYLRHLYKR